MANLCRVEPALRLCLPPPHVLDHKAVRVVPAPASSACVSHQETRRKARKAGVHAMLDATGKLSALSAEGRSAVGPH